MSGYSIKSLQPLFYSVQGSIQIGERCCDKFYYDGVNRTDPTDECYIECQGSNQYNNLPRGQDTPNFVGGTADDGNFTGGGGQSGGGGASGGW
jgi:uncharacterized membrane protein YgcG